MKTPQDITNFWFNELKEEDWWKKDHCLDKKIKEHFFDIHQKAINCELYSWRINAEGCLAEIIIIDQFSRNIFRDRAQSFLYDGLALALAQNAVYQKHDQNLDTKKKAFLYMPYMHSESAAIHKIAVELFSQPGLESNLEFELKHKYLIDKFGRYPHRNKVLNRESSNEELEFLKQPGSSF